jgi:hypothetical protein
MARLTLGAIAPAAGDAGERRPPAWWLAWAAGVGGTALLYLLGSFHLVPPHVLRECALDKVIGFHPDAVWPYLSFFLMQASAFCFIPARYRVSLAKAFLFCASFALAVFLAYPTTLLQPAMSSASAGLSVIRLIDTPSNCLPSLHAALSILSCAALSVDAPKRRKVLSALWTVAICWSAIATRQHLTIDISAGALLGLGASVLFLSQPFHLRQAPR